MIKPPIIPQVPMAFHIATKVLTDQSPKATKSSIMEQPPPEHKEQLDKEVHGDHGKENYYHTSEIITKGIYQVKAQQGIDEIKHYFFLLLMKIKATTTIRTGINTDAK